MSQRTFFSEWILPIASKPIKDGYITISDDQIIALGKQADFHGKKHDVEDLGNAVISPALINALFHPDYPVADPQTTPRGNFLNWLHSGKNHYRSSSKLEIESELLSAIKRCYDYGTSAIGIRTYHPHISEYFENSGLYSVVFQMLRGFRENDTFEVWKNRLQMENNHLTHYYEAGEFLFNLNPHLLRKIAFNNPRTALPISFLKDEDLFFNKGQGRIYQYLLGQEDMDYRWQPPGQSALQYFLSQSLAAENTILSQMIYATEEELDLLSEQKESYHICLHPRFDRQWELGSAPGEMIRDKGFNICLGTFAEHMDIRAEMRSASAEYGFRPDEIMKMATLNGAMALGLDDKLGSLEAGKDARLSVVRSQSSIADPYNIILFTNERLRQLF